MRYAIRFAAALIGLFIILYVIALIYLSSNKGKINELIVSQVNKQICGVVNIGDLNTEFFKTFPVLSLSLANVSIRDSLWENHYHEFLQAKKIYIRPNLLSLLTGKPKIGKVIVEDGTIYYYTDECGYCNFIARQNTAPKPDQVSIPDVRLIRTRLVVINEFLNSRHDLEANDINCKVTQKDSVCIVDVQMNALCHGIGFNLDKGSYLKEKKMEGHFLLTYVPNKKIELNNVKLKIDHHPFNLNGQFKLDTEPKSYNLHIKAEKVLYGKGAGLLTESLQGKVKIANIVQPFDISANISGKMAYRVVPEINLEFNVADADLEISLGTFEECSFSGTFTNHLDSLSQTGDVNSKFIFNHFKGVLSGIPVTSHQIDISNLIQPYMICDLQSKFSLKNLNDLSNSSTIRFTKGEGELELNYSGALSRDTISSVLNGSLCIAGAQIVYAPRNLVFNDCSGQLEFNNEDLIISQIVATSGSTNLNMSGRVVNFLALLNINPEQLNMEWNISTPELNLSDFITYIGGSATDSVKQTTAKNKKYKTTDNIDRMLREGIATLNLTANKVFYKKFTGTGVNATVIMVENKLILDDVKLNHAGGRVSLHGSLSNTNHLNPLVLETRIEQVDIPQLFHAFDNFGQDAITSKNMKGNLSATIRMNGIITDKAEVKENSMQGTVEFSVRDGELINFEPVMNIASTAFKNRDFSHLVFAELNNQLEIEGSKITFSKMEIRSNVVTLFVEGVYDKKTGTDMSIQVPISTLTSTEQSMEKQGRAGPNIRLRAKTGDDGKLKVSWDPFNNASKQRKSELK